MKSYDTVQRQNPCLDSLHKAVPATCSKTFVRSIGGFCNPRSWKQWCSGGHAQGHICHRCDSGRIWNTKPLTSETELSDLL